MNFEIFLSTPFFIKQLQWVLPTSTSQPLIDYQSFRSSISTQDSLGGKGGAGRGGMGGGGGGEIHIELVSLSRTK